jgi:hypothetical protein
LPARPSNSSAPDLYRQTFSLTRLDDVIALHPDRETALAAAQG